MRGPTTSKIADMSCDVPRYLVPFHPKRIPHHFADVLIIGGGIAGLRAAMAIDPRLSLLVITKDKLEQSNSTYAQGGIAERARSGRPLRETTSPTRSSPGANLCDREVVEMVVREAPGAHPPADRLGHATSTRSRAS